ncbi:sialic acid-binding Ig-like lectin 15 [Heterodontus francisci]|uniref:sialic acid-binding Ig-like lectin 15 n=1 Tax=Heterodontus francisci TaxID=7792 RepID=UPI00355B97E4
MLAILLCAFTQVICTGGLSKHGWTMESPDRVTGREGKPAVLFCKFTHPHCGYKGNITLTWKEKGRNMVLFSCTNYLSLNSQIIGFENLIHQNVDKRYRVMGNLRENDASIIINQLTLRDNYQQYICLVDLKDYSNETSQSSIQTILVVAADEKNMWPVSGKKRDSVTLSCTFNPPDLYLTSITVLWMKENPHKESTVFNHTRSFDPGSYYTDPIIVNEDNRFELIGNPTQGNASIRMRDLQLNDSSDYFCHVHVKNGGGENVTQDVVKLQVVAPATILELSAVNDNISGDTIMCRVEGEPPANITWIDPENNTLPEDSNSATVTRVPDKHQTVGEFLNPTLRGTYSCVAVNEHGRDVCQIHFSTVDAIYSNFIVGMLCLIPLVKFLLLLITGIILFIKIKD